jgi:hypothetical protein
MASTLQLPTAFADAYRDFEKYPNNLIDQSAYLDDFTGYRKRFDDHEDLLVEHGDTRISIRFLDAEDEQIIAGSGPLWRKYESKDDESLREWLGDKTPQSVSGEDSSGPSASIQPVLTKKDPKCRFM